MNERKKIFLVPAHFGSLDTDPVSRYIAEAREVLGGNQIEYVETRSLTDLDSIPAVEAQLAVGECEAILLYMITWVDPNVIVDFMLRHARLPVIIWVADYFRRGGAKVHLGALAGFLPVKGTLEELDIPCVYFYQAEISKESAKELADMIAAAAAVNRITRARIGMVGYTALGMYPGMVHPLQIKQKFGTEIVSLDSHSLIGRCDELLKNADSPHRIESCFRNLGGAENLSAADRDKCAAMTEAIRQLVAEYGLSAITIRCCFEMAADYGFTPCVPLSVLSDQCVTSCESDIPVTLTQLILHYLAGKPAAYVDLLIVEDFRIHASCCGFSALAYARNAIRRVDYSSIEGETTAYAYPRVISASGYEEGPYTLARLILPMKSEPFLHVIYGENKNDFESFREYGCKQFPSLNLTVNRSKTEILERLTSQHYALLKGNVLGKLKYYCQFMKMELKVL
jgi:L-fucose isomerase-like protein